MEIEYVVNKIVVLKDREKQLNEAIRVVERELELLESYAIAKFGPTYSSFGRVIAGTEAIVCGNKVLLFSGYYEPCLRVITAETVPMGLMRALPEPGA